jgi:cytoskeletal protein CcmA (bactofilin family)
VHSNTEVVYDLIFRRRQMGFFKDFKRDFAQAVNELMPDKDEMASEYDDEDMVNTFDENDNMDIAPEDMLEDIDDYGGEDNNQLSGGMYGSSDDMYDTSEETETFVDDGGDSSDAESNTDDYRDVPPAELISEHDFNDLNSLNDLNDMENTEAYETYSNGADLETVEQSEAKGEDELKSLENLDEQNMLEGMEDASRLDTGVQMEEQYYGNPFEQIGEDRSELHEMDLTKDIEDAIMKEEAVEMTEQENIRDGADYEMEDYGKEEYAAGAFPEADKFREDVMAEVEMNSQATETSKNIDDIFEVDTTYITKNTTIKGSLSTEGSVDVLGTVKGNVSCKGKLIVGGTIKGDIEAGEIYANAAKIEGIIEAEGSVKIGVGSVVVGDVMATSAVIAGAVNGDIDVHGPVIVDSTAVIMGNIKSRSVQINNGAVIEGFCSQCYSEIDVKSFFDMESDDDDEEEDSQKKNEKDVKKNDENDSVDSKTEKEAENEAENVEEIKADDDAQDAENNSEKPSENKPKNNNNNSNNSNRKNRKSGKNNNRNNNNSNGKSDNSKNQENSEQSVDGLTTDESASAGTEENKEAENE